MVWVTMLWPEAGMASTFSSRGLPSHSCPSTPGIATGELNTEVLSKLANTDPGAPWTMVSTGRPMANGARNGADGSLFSFTVGVNVPPGPAHRSWSEMGELFVAVAVVARCALEPAVPNALIMRG